MEGYITETDKIIEQIEMLCNIPSPSGFTKEAEEYIVKYFIERRFYPYQTNKGNIIVPLGGEGNPLVLAAHIDTLGAMVRSIKPDGRLRVTHIGGFPSVSLEQENCIIHTRKGKEYTGTFQLKNPAVHANKKLGTTERTDENIEIVIDEKVFNKEDVKKLGISAGDFVSFDPRTIVTENGFIKSRHLDDKASSAILMVLAESIHKQALRLNRKVYLMFTNYEEVGHGGSAGTPEDVREFISVDMGVVGDDLETDEYKVSICAKAGRGPYDYDVTNKLVEIAQRKNLNYAIDIYPYYAADSDMALFAGCDVKHAVMGPGVFASHGYERVHKEGLQNTFSLLKSYITE